MPNMFPSPQFFIPSPCRNKAKRLMAVTLGVRSWEAGTPGHWVGTQHTNKEPSRRTEPPFKEWKVSGSVPDPLTPYPYRSCSIRSGVAMEPVRLSCRPFLDLPEVPEVPVHPPATSRLPRRAGSSAAGNHPRIPYSVDDRKGRVWTFDVHVRTSYLTQHSNLGLPSAA